MKKYHHPTESRKYVYYPATWAFSPPSNDFANENILLDPYTDSMLAVHNDELEAHLQSMWNLSLR